MKKSRGWWIIGLVALAILIGIVFRFRSRPAELPAVSARQDAPQVAVDDDTEPDYAARDAAQRRIILGGWSELIRWMKSEPRPTAEEIAARLKQLRIDWVAMDPTVLTAAIQEILRSGMDLETGLKFAVGPHGFLDDWPTLRVFLLDVLAAADPEASAPVARGVLDTTESANEFAMAMRSLVREGPGRAGNDELVLRLGALLGHSGWLREPGFAEAFDLPRAIGTPAAARVLAAWDGNPALKAMALDEFAAAHPGAVADLVTSPEASALDPAQRANLMARIDPADSAQLAAADAYFRNPGLGSEEAGEFLKSFPLRSATTGYRLYGENPAPYSKEGIAAGDRAALDQVNRWLADPALADRYRAGLEPLQRRLDGWVKQAASR